MRRTIVVILLFAFSSAYAEPRPAVPEGAIPIQGLTASEQDLKRNSELEQVASGLDQPVGSMGVPSTTPVPAALVQNGVRTHGSEPPPIRKRSVIRNPDRK